MIRALILGMGLMCSIQAGASDSAALATARLAFVSIRSGDPHIYLRNDKGGEHMLTEGKGIHLQPSMAADGRLAFVKQVNGVPKVMSVRADGSAAYRVTASDRGETSPAWSPDGRSLAFFSMDMASGDQELLVIDVDRAGVSKISGLGKSLGPAPVSWSVDGSRLAVLATAAGDRKSTLYVMRRDGSDVRDLSSGFAPRGAIATSLSPDGRSVAWVADMRERQPIIVTDIETSSHRDLSAGIDGAHESPRWSPDGRQIVFVGAREGGAEMRNDIFVMDADGSNVRNLSRHPHEDFDPRWSADGRSIVFASLRNGTSHLFEVSLINGQTRQLSHHGSHDMDHVT